MRTTDTMNAPIKDSAGNPDDAWPCRDTATLLAEAACKEANIAYFLDLFDVVDAKDGVGIDTGG